MTWLELELHVLAMLQGFICESPKELVETHGAALYAQIIKDLTMAAGIAHDKAKQ